MPRRPKYPAEVKIRIPKDKVDIYETPVLELLLPPKEAEMAEKIINYIKKNGRLWPDEWKEVLEGEITDANVKAYYRALKKLVSLGLIGRGKEGSFILSDELAMKLMILTEKVNALVRSNEKQK